MSVAKAHKLHPMFTQAPGPECQFILKMRKTPQRRKATKRTIFKEADNDD